MVELRLFCRRGRLGPCSRGEVELIPPRAKDFVLFGAGQKRGAGARHRPPAGSHARSRPQARPRDRWGKDSTRIFLRDCDRFLEPDCQRAFASESRGPTFSTRARRGDWRGTGRVRSLSDAGRQCRYDFQAARISLSGLDIDWRVDRHQLRSDHCAYKKVRPRAFTTLSCGSKSSTGDVLAL